MTRYFSLALLLLIAAFGHSASAASVTFDTQTTGGFGGSDATSGGLSLATGSSQITFAGLTGIQASGSFDVVTIGWFTLTTTVAGSAQDVFDSLTDTFTVTITPTNPAGAPGSSTANILAEVTSTDGGALVFNFAPTSFTIGNASYSVQNTQLTFPAGGTSTAELKAVVRVADGASSSTPLPATATGGLGLMSLFALRRNRQVAA